MPRHAGCGIIHAMKKIAVMLSAALAASVVFANAWDGVLIKGRTDKDNPVGYKSVFRACRFLG